MIYITSDIHGCYEEFMELLETIKFSKEDTLYILGDMIDRGPEPIKVLQYIMKQDNMKVILGNHEDMMLEYFKELENKHNQRDFFFARDCWFQNGGEITLQKLQELSEDEQKKCVEYIKNLPLYEKLELDGKTYLLVHAGFYPYDFFELDEIDELLSSQTKDDLVWIREEFIQSTKKYPFVTIFGHTPTPNVAIYTSRLEKFMKFKNKDFKLLDSYEECKMIHFNNKIGIDCGCYFGYNLGCLCLDTMEEIYIKNKK